MINLVAQLRLFLLLFVVCVVSERELTVNKTTWIAGSVSNNVIETVSFNIKQEHIDKAIRISTVSNEANLRVPIFISVRQGRRITSWTLPYVEAGYAYSKVDRTLCPLLNQPLNDYTSHMIYIDISTPSHFNVSYNISAQFVHDYQLKFNNPINVSVLSPVFYVFEYPDNVDSALVKVTSQDISQCAIVSIQESICPNDQLLDYPEHRGTYQTMEKLAAINYKRPTHQNYIYVVISVYHHEDCTEANSDLIDGIITLNVSANYNPVHVNGNTSMSKDVTIVIDHTLSTSQYWVGMVTLSSILLVFCAISLSWVIIDGFFCYRNHSVYKLFAKFDIEKEKGVDKIATTIRPTFLSVIKGTQWIYEIERRTTPSPRSPNFIDNEFARALDKVNPVTSNVPLATNSFSHDQLCPLILPIATSDAVFPLDVETNNDVIDHNVTSNDVIDNNNDVIDNTREDRINIDTLSINSNSSTCSYGIYDGDIHQIHANDDTSVSQNDMLYSVVIESNDTESSTFHKQHSQTVDMNNHHYLTLENQCYIHQLHINNDDNTIHKQYNVYWIYLIVIFLFYSIPVYQLILTYQRYVHLSGNQDFCYYNTLCSHPLGIFSAFNNIWSNIGFLVLGILFLIIAFRRRRMYKLYEKINDYYEEQGKPEAKLGIPQQFGIYYAAGSALIFESFLSAAYHFCPTGDNYQFDTAMMFVLVILGIYQLNKFRNPDIHASPHNLLLVLSLLILLIGIGVMYSGLIFYIVFFIIFEAATIYTSLQIYYRWKIKLYPVNSLVTVIKELKYSITHPCPPQHKPKFAYFIVSNILNILFATYGIVYQPTDFATYFLGVLIGNFIMSLLYYVITKICYREFGRKFAISKSIFYLILALLFWITGIVLYSWTVTDWLKSPAGSRNNNQQCILFGFYDTHDLWHFLSAFALFFSFLLLMTLDDNEELLDQSKLHVF